MSAEMFVLITDIFRILPDWVLRTSMSGCECVVNDVTNYIVIRAPDL
jgi:hypothetical protein